jgi:DNA ligase-associated metallophosphoesterase
MSAALPITLAGEPVMLDSRRALYWPGGGVLALADVHLGKGALLRSRDAAGRHTAADIEEIADLLDDYRPQRLIFCGNPVHPLARDNEAWLDALRGLRQRYKDTHFEIALGNDDSGAQLPADLDISVAERITAPPFVFLHEPEELTEGYGIAGHWHPVTVLRGMGDALSQPVFWTRAGFAVLPAFGSFTGGMEAAPEPGDQLFAVSPQAVQAIPLPHSSSNASQRNPPCAS